MVRTIHSPSQRSPNLQPNTVPDLDHLFHAAILMPASSGLLTALVVCLLLIHTSNWHSDFSSDSTIGIQKFHTTPTPRIGGISVFAGAWVACLLAPNSIEHILQPILIAGLPAFIFGLVEDFTQRVGVRTRLLATMASGVVAWYLTGYSIAHVGIWGLDSVLVIPLVSVLFTAFMIGGLANAINLIDGFNGLASLTSALAFIGYACIAYQVGDLALAGTCIALTGCVLGFFVTNWPFGKIFMGDGGSYFVGFALAWVAVTLMHRYPQVSSFAVLLVCVHPFMEVVFSIYRRAIKSLHIGHPDRLHLHSLLKQRYVRRWLRDHSIRRRNSITGLLVACLTIPPILAANLVYDRHLLSAATLVVFALIYVAIYLRMVQHRFR
jgi:UDP-N-acetylmuramyl pentapeptide phosphotransferase/UDP-N-acetylglucosamine-1-phosphate transferase